MGEEAVKLPEGEGERGRDTVVLVSCRAVFSRASSGPGVLTAIDPSATSIASFYCANTRGRRLASAAVRALCGNGLQDLTHGSQRCY